MWCQNTQLKFQFFVCIRICVQEMYFRTEIPIVCHVKRFKSSVLFLNFIIQRTSNKPTRNSFPQSLYGHFVFVLTFALALDVSWNSPFFRYKNLFGSKKIRNYAIMTFIQRQNIKKWEQTQLFVCIGMTDTLEMRMLCIQTSDQFCERIYTTGYETCNNEISHCFTHQYPKMETVLSIRSTA